MRLLCSTSCLCRFIPRCNENRLLSKWKSRSARKQDSASAVCMGERIWALLRVYKWSRNVCRSTLIDLEQDPRVIEHFALPSFSVFDMAALTLKVFCLRKKLFRHLNWNLFIKANRFAHTGAGSDILLKRSRYSSKENQKSAHKVGFIQSTSQNEKSQAKKTNKTVSLKAAFFFFFF